MIGVQHESLPEKKKREREKEDLKRERNKRK